MNRSSGNLLQYGSYCPHTNSMCRSRKLNKGMYSVPTVPHTSHTERKTVTAKDSDLLLVSISSAQLHF